MKSKTINSTIIGELIQDSQLDDWWENNNVHIPLIEAKLSVIFRDFEPENDLNFINEADFALTNFFKLKPNYKNEISTQIYDEFLNFSSMVGINDIPTEMKNITVSEIWNFVAPHTVYVTRGMDFDGTNDIYVSLGCECDWEIEHGLELFFKDGVKLTTIQS